MSFGSLLSRAASNDPTFVKLEINYNLSYFSHGLPANHAELVQLVVDALATNTYVKSLKLTELKLTETEIAPLAELLKTRDFEELDLRSNNLTGESLFPALAVRDALRVLNLSSNKRLTALEHLTALNSLKELDLGDCSLSAVSLGVLQMPHLEVLKLDDNPLKTLPASFASLSNLKQLYASGCEFADFPTVLFGLTQLETLDISNNQLSIPDDIAALVNLKVFVAFDCGLKGFPIAITELVRLEVLNLRRNNIQRVPDEIGNLQSVKVLNLADCGLTALPVALWTLVHLEELNLASNPLTSLPGGIGALSKLKELNMSDSSTKKLPSEMQQLSLLAFFNLSGTELTHLPVWLASLPLLNNLRCFNCPVHCVALDDNTFVAVDELAALLSDSSDPREVEIQKKWFKDMARLNQLRLLRLANMHFAPRTPLRALCASKCVAHRSSVDLARLPAHIRDEIARAVGVGTQQ